MFSFFVRMNEVFFHVNDSLHSSSFFHNIGQDIDLNFGTRIVSLHRSYNFDCIVFVFNDVKALESSPKCSITKVCINLNNIR
jgi:hypothetical protein